MITGLLAVPLIGLLILLLLPRTAARVWTLAVLAAGPVQVWWLRPTAGSGWAHAERYAWIPTLGIEYSVAVDGISWLLLALTAVTGFLAALSSWSAITLRVREYSAMLLLLQTAMYGVFVAQDLILFFIFFEFALVPMYFLIGVWGGERRLYAAIKFFLYTLAGSLLLLVAILGLYFTTGARTFDAATLFRAPLTAEAARWIFWGFFLAFAIKIPMVPFHTWLPDAHTEAPTAGSVLLAAVLLKMGTYGMLRFGLPLLSQTPDAASLVRGLAIASIVAILYGALISLVQQDWKRLVAYSSVSHLGFCTLGLFSLNADGISGSVLQQLNHGISTGLLFLLVGMIYERRHTREIREFGGLAGVMPNFAIVFALAMFSSAGLPLLNGFVGEFTILTGAYAANPSWAFAAVPGIVLGAAYLLWLFQRTMLGRNENPANRGLADLNLREWLTLAPLALWAVAIGLYPRPYFEMIESPVRTLLEGLK